MEMVMTLAFNLYLIACCLFAPADSKTFEIELREAQGGIFKEKGVIMYVERTDTGFSIYADKERKGDHLTVKKDGDRYVITQESGGKKTECVIDNSKAKIAPLDKDGEYTREIEGCKLTFELKDGKRKVYQKNNDTMFLVRAEKKDEEKK